MERKSPSDTAAAVDRMRAFADRTGLTSDRPPRRYLWTDAFAVCNFLGLARETGDPNFDALALRLVDQVHRVLGRHRPDDSRRGWISGLDEQGGARHPTRGGLRIGKELPERPKCTPIDPQLEWERDGQYFHYLTKWMHALDQCARALRRPELNVWARELADIAHRTFAVGPSRRIAWKMSIDLTRPLVASMGQHDPLDGFVTAVQLQATARELGNLSEGPDLEDVVADLATLLREEDWATEDPLGLGGVLVDACRVDRLIRLGALDSTELLHALLTAATRGLLGFSRANDLGQPASRRLAFRELGLAIGLQALERLGTDPETRAASGPEDVDRCAWNDLVLRYQALGRSIIAFWRTSEARASPTWAEHRDIDEVMLATALVPEGLLPLVRGRTR
jgi:hypothetical protein